MGAIGAGVTYRTQTKLHAGAVPPGPQYPVKSKHLSKPYVIRLLMPVNIRYYNTTKLLCFIVGEATILVLSMVILASIHIVGTSGPDKLCPNPTYQMT